MNGPQPFEWLSHSFGPNQKEMSNGTTGNNSNLFNSGIQSFSNGLLASEATAESNRRPSIAERVVSGVGVGIRKASGVFGSNSSSQNQTGPGTSLLVGSEASGSGFIGDLHGLEAHVSMNPEDYELKQVIGQGSSAIVYLAVCKVTGKQVSIKVIDLDMFERNQIDELRRELQIMTLSKHPNLLPVYGSFVNGSKLFIVTPFLSAGSGLDIMKTAFQKGMDEAIIATILKQVLQGLEYLHLHGLIHRDIKAGNLLVGSDGLVQLADFGVSSSLTDHGIRGTSRKTFVGTPCWMAPEVMDQSGYDYKADIWSFGITALELANGHAPYAKYPPMKVLMLTLQNPPPTLDRDATYYKYSKAFKDMIDACLQKDSAKRPTAEKLLTHPFFKAAKKPAYLVSTLLNGLTPITERTHLQKHHDNTIRSSVSDQNEEWDFETSASTVDRKSLLDDLEKETGGVQFNVPEKEQRQKTESNLANPPQSKSRVSFQPTPETVFTGHTPAATQAAEPLESDTLLGTSAVPFSSSSVINEGDDHGTDASRDGTPLIASSTCQGNRLSSIVSASSSNDATTTSSSSMPRKSRFTVDTPASATRTDSVLSTTSVSNEPGSVGVPSQGGANQLSPILAGITAGATQVQKGRFSVIDSKAAVPPITGTSGSGSIGSVMSAVPPVMALPPSVLPSSLPTQVVSETSEGSSQVPSDTGMTTLERKAGRFAFQNLPTSTVTSPILGASDGPKVPRNRFTIVSESNADVTSSVGQVTGSLMNSSPTRLLPEKGVEGGKKTSRFRIVGDSDGLHEEAILNHAALILNTPIPGLPVASAGTNSATGLNISGEPSDGECESGSPLVVSLVKMIETQRSVIADLISVVKSVPVRSLSSESGLGGPGQEK